MAAVFIRWDIIFNMLSMVVTMVTAGIAALWAAGLCWLIVTYRKQPVLEPMTEGEVESRVSIIVPARNEGLRILQKSIGSMLDQDHPILEVIAVNDRSTDNTLEILQGIQNGNGGNRLRIVDGTDLPEGWLGKPYALEQGFRVSKGDWILTTDADIVLSPKAVRTAVRYAELNGYDALTLVPRLDLESFWERVFMPVFGWFCLLAMPLDRVNDPKRSESLGVGNFFLLRRTALEQLGGFSSIKSDVAEDLKLAEIVKKTGLGLRIETAPELLRTRMYSGLGEIWAGFTKNLFSALKFSIVIGTLAFLSILAFGVMPVIATPILFTYGFQLAAGFALLAYLMQTLAFVIILRNIEQNPMYAVLMPLGFFVYGLILLNSMIKIVTGKGVTWKGRAIYESGGVVPPKA